MKSSLKEFLAQAKSMSLSDDERRASAALLGISVRNEESPRQNRAMSLTTFMKTAKRISMSPAERVLCKEAIVAGLEQRNAFSWWMPFRHLSAVMAAFLIVVLTSGICYAAEDALPGDVLYPVKVHVNEEVRIALALSAEQRARLETKRAGKRLSEAEALAAQGRLSEKAAAILSMELQNHIVDIKAHVNALSAEGNVSAAEDVGGDIDATLSVHERLLGTTRVMNQGMGSIRTMVQSIREARFNIAETALKNDDDAAHKTTESVVMDAEEKVEKAEKETRGNPGVEERIGVAKKALQKAKSSASNDERKRDMAAMAVKAAREAGVLSGIVQKVRTASPAAVTIPKEDSTDDDATVEQEISKEKAFDAEVRIRKAKKHLRSIKETIEDSHSSASRSSSAQSIDIRIRGTEQLIRDADRAIESGNGDDALRQSKEALKHSEAVRAEVQLEQGADSGAQSSAAVTEIQQVKEEKKEIKKDVEDVLKTTLP